MARPGKLQSGRHALIRDCRKMEDERERVCECFLSFSCICVTVCLVVDACTTCVFAHVFL